MRERQRREQGVDAIEPVTQIVRPLAEAEAQIAVHPEVIAGNDETFFSTRRRVTSSVELTR